MPTWERILIYVLLIAALGLGGYSTYRNSVIDGKGRALTAWADKTLVYLTHVHEGHIHHPNAPQYPGDHISPPPKPPKW